MKNVSKITITNTAGPEQKENTKECQKKSSLIRNVRWTVINQNYSTHIHPLFKLCHDDLDKTILLFYLNHHDTVFWNAHFTTMQTKQWLPKKVQKKVQKMPQQNAILTWTRDPQWKKKAHAHIRLKRCHNDLNRTVMHFYLNHYDTVSLSSHHLMTRASGLRRLLLGQDTGQNPSDDSLDLAHLLVA